MSLPPTFLDELRNRLSLTQVVGRKVMWDQRKSNQGKGDMWAPCPFHHEKTASFHVDDRKGYYYCFGCHAKGDAISFVRETENVTFMEAIEILATEAGMPMPARDPQARERADKKKSLSDVVELAVEFFRFQLKRGVAREATAYLQKRGLSAQALEKFEIGFAPAGWENLREHLKSKDVPIQMMLEAGLVKASDKGREPYDVFRNRIMFPIRDARGRAIGFGGRAMDPNDNAKYLNSPETPLFDKSNTLYNFKAAREAAGKGQQLIAAEGYMDVIALSEAGFEAAVAPLGTAVTENQLALMWRAHRTPVFMLDGDKAGQRAQARVIDIALPQIKAGQSVTFVTLPEGKDPDDMIRGGGVEQLRRMLEEPTALHLALWNRERDAGPRDTPEQKADFEKRLLGAVRKIPDQHLQKLYFEEFRQLKRSNFPSFNNRPEFRGFRKFPGKGVPAAATPSARASLLAQSQDETDFERVRERKIAAICWQHRDGGVVQDMRPALEDLDLEDPANVALIHAILFGEGTIDSTGQAPHLDLQTRHALETVLGDPFVKVDPALRQDRDADYIRHALAENISFLKIKRGDRLALEELMDDISAMSEEQAMHRYALEERARSAAGQPPDEDADYEIAPSGALMDRREREALDNLLAQIQSNKGGG